MGKRFSKRTAALSLSVVLALVLGIGMVSSMLDPVPTPPAGVRVAEDEDAASNSPAAPEDDQQANAPLDTGEPVPEPNSEADDPEQEDASAPALAERVFTMPEGVDYEPQVALVKVDPSASVDQVNEGLLATDGVIATQLSAQDVAEGYVLVELSPHTSVEDAVNELLAAGVVEDAQPNYVYYVSDLVEGDSSDEASHEPSWEEAGEGLEQSTSDDGVQDPGASDSGAQEAPGQAPNAQEQEHLQETSQSEQSDLLPTDSGDSSTAAALPAESGQNATDSGDSDSSVPVSEASAEAGKTVNDPNSEKQWGLQSIHAYEAWELQDASHASSSVTVAVMDVGFNVDHEDLAGNILIHGGSRVVYNASADSNNASVAPVSSSNRNHGTHVAGIISAVADNNKGIAGASYNARLLPIRMAALNSSGEAVITSQSFGRAFNYIKNNRDAYHIHVVNISLGSSTSFDADGVVTNGFRECYENGVVVVTSAGNLDGRTSAYAHYPSDDTHCMAVMGLAQSGSGVVKSSSSNYNRSTSDHKDICAPGDGIYSTLYDTSSSYGYMSGTSMATPFVSAVVALEYAANPSLSAQEAMDYLHATSTDLGDKGWDLYYGYGEVNAYAALQAVQAGSLTSAQRARLNEQGQTQDQDTKTTDQQQSSAASQQQLEKQRNAAAASSIRYRTHVQNIGWQEWKSGGATAGTSGQSKRLEAIKINLVGAPYSGGIRYRTHVQGIGWQGWKSNGDLSGTSGQSKRLEAIQIQLTGEMASHYDVWYRVHAQTYGWLGWAKNGARSGTATLSKRLEAIQIRILPKGSAAPGSTTRPYVTRQVSYRTHVQGIGWQGWVYDGALSGTSGQSRRLEAINITLADPLYGGGIRYRTHVQGIGWQGWKSNGALSGTSGQSRRLEAIQIQLTGEMASHYDVWYRVHAQAFGWMGWAKNGASAGTAGYSRRLEAIQIRLVAKGSAAPGSTSGAFRQR